VIGDLASGGEETTTLLGTFYPTNQGSFTGGWQSVKLMDSSSNLATVTFTGSNVTLRVEVSTNSSNPFPADGSQGDSVNLNYFMLIPTTTSTNVDLTKPTVTAKLSGTTLTLSFPSQTSAYYQVQYKTTLTDSTWTSVGAKQTGTGSTLSITDTVGTGTRFYRVYVTQ
jgi:predicted choloylglycine hydrolase